MIQDSKASGEMYSLLYVLLMLRTISDKAYNFTIDVIDNVWVIT
jgi:hypothetical protein